MNLTPVVGSSSIEHIGYEGNVLTVHYKGGRGYRYSGVPADKAEQIIASAADESVSTGKLVNSLVKAGGYSFEKVGK